MAVELDLDAMFEDSPEVLAELPPGVKRFWLADPGSIRSGVCVEAFKGSIKPASLAEQIYSEAGRRQAELIREDSERVRVRRGLPPTGPTTHTYLDEMLAKAQKRSDGSPGKARKNS